MGIGGCSSDPFPVAASSSPPPLPPPGCNLVTASGTTLSTARLPKLSLEAALPRNPNLERKLSATSPARPPFSVVAGFRRSLSGGFSDFDLDFPSPVPEATRAAAPNRAALRHSLRASRAYPAGDVPVALLAVRFALADFFFALADFFVVFELADFFVVEVVAFRAVLDLPAMGFLSRFNLLLAVLRPSSPPCPPSR